MNDWSPLEQHIAAHHRQYFGTLSGRRTSNVPNFKELPMMTPKQKKLSELLFRLEHVAAKNLVPDGARSLRSDKIVRNLCEEAQELKEFQGLLEEAIKESQDSHMTDEEIRLSEIFFKRYIKTDSAGVSHSKVTDRLVRSFRGDTEGVAEVVTLMARIASPDTVPEGSTLRGFIFERGSSASDSSIESLMEHMLGSHRDSHDT